MKCGQFYWGEQGRSKTQQGTARNIETSSPTAVPVPSVHGLKQLDVLLLTLQVEGTSLEGHLQQESDAVILKT